MNLALKILLPIGILLAAILVARTIIENKPEPRTRPSFDAAQAVEATTLKPSTYQVIVRSQGTVRASRERTVVPEVAGIIRTLSPNLVTGGHFAAGEVLLEIDDRDYRIALAQAEAGFAEASAKLQEEQARAKQALADWQSLGRKGKPTGLTAREPQLAAARAGLAAARAQVQQARLDVERTQIIAPYQGSVLSITVAEGEFVNRGANLGTIYNTDSAEVRLPLADNQLAHLRIPSPGEVGATVTLTASIGGRESSWRGQLIRAEGVDAATQQLNVVANIENPQGSDGGQASLRVGQFVSAAIQGNTLENVFVIPAAALREGSEVLLIDDEQQLRKQTVSVAWADDEFVAIDSGLKPGDILTLTTLSAVTNGTRVAATIDGVAPAGGRGSTAIAGNARGSGSAERAAGSGGGGDREARMARLKAMVDSGEKLPAEVIARVQRRIDAGEPVPGWLKSAIENQ